ncbi:MAG: hypothetical protein HUK14_04235 [Muribaculaceae bacterium]|nr:hypothetical protein [Muribaculaceae bacterium]
MESIFKKIIDAIDSLNSSVSKDYEEIRKCKKDIQALRASQINDMTVGRFIRDDRRIILSAPEIVIGNVDMNGMEYGGSTISLRGQQINLQGTGIGGSVTTQANHIAMYAEDPGPDGNEAVVHDSSSIAIMAKNVALDSNNSSGTFSHRMMANAGGLSLHSDSSINISSSFNSTSIKEAINNEVSSLSSTISSLKSDISSLNMDLKTLNATFEALLTTQEALQVDDMMIYANVTNINDMSMQLEAQSQVIMNKIAKYLNKVTALAEATRRKSDLENQLKDNFPDENQIKTGANGCVISLSGEAITLDAKDSFGNPRTTLENSGIFLNSPNTVIGATNLDRRNIPDSVITLQGTNINVVTANLKDADKEKTALKDMGFESEGKVNIISKEITMRAIDYKANEEKKDNYHIEKLTDKGSIKLQAESISTSSVNEKGEAVGQIDLNSKYIQLMSANLDPDKGSIKELTKESTLAVITENVLVGSSDEKAATKVMQLNAEETLINDKTSLTAMQDKAFMELKGGKLTIGSSENTISGKTAVNNALEVTGKTTMTDADIKSANISTHLKAPNLEGGAGSGGAKTSDSKTEAKLKDLKFKEEAGGGSNG